MSWAETKILLDAIVENGISSSNGTIMMVPFDANKYGYNLRIYDIDGVTPLPDVKINGVSDPTTEIRTNADGIAKFISSSPSHTVSFTEFPSGYQYADVFTQRTIRGYINDMTEVIVAPNISNFAGYNITLLDNTGSPVANRTVQCTQNGRSYTTNRSGQIAQTIYSTATSLTFTWSISGQYNKSTDGSLQIYDTTANYSATVSGGQIGAVKPLTSANASPSYSGRTAKINISAIVGQYVTIGTRQYVITHTDSSNVYVALRYHEQDAQFGRNTEYSSSTIASLCTTWYNDNVPALWKNTANAFNDVTVEGVTAKCFIPTHGMANGGWSYFNSNSRRIFTASSGSARDWWTASASSSSGVWLVDLGGDLAGVNPRATCGFRPCLAIKRSLFS